MEDFAAETALASAVYYCKDFCRIVLITGDATYHYADKQQRAELPRLRAQGGRILRLSSAGGYSIPSYRTAW